jgi:uncharacterized protein YjbI with pentapeptide repeats
MANRDQLSKIREGAIVWNNWRRTHVEHRPRGLDTLDLSAANLNGLELGGANLSRINLGRATLCGTELSRADLSGTDFSGANLTDAQLTGADLIGANLVGAKLISANLSGANFSGANLRQADLSKAKLLYTTFADTNLSKAMGLDSCIHQGPSSIGIDTFFKSSGTIPEIFLRGCGVPDQFITYSRSMIRQPLEFYSCFISYSSHDQQFAERLHADLRANHLRCWFAPEDLKIGDAFQDGIEQSIRSYDRLMIVLSESSIRSPWVEREVLAAREREDRQKRPVIFPIRIDDAIMDAEEAWAADIRRGRHIGDFSGWRSDVSYKRAFDRLLRDLNAQGNLKTVGAS